jgi:excisionase family DNA binding protein
MPLINGNEILTPSKADSKLARESSEKLAVHLGRSKGLRLEVKSGTASEELMLPSSVLRLLVRLLAEVGQGHGVALTPLRADLTSQQAADILNVSRPHLVKLLDQGAIPSHKVGTHRRVRTEDLLAYKREFLAKRHAVLDELQALSQDLKMGY